MKGTGSIDVFGVHKSFRKYHAESVKESVLRVIKGQSLYERRAVLHDVSFSITPGEAVALVGRNGAGKSTLFRILSRIYQPDRGTVVINGRISPLIELTAGLVPDMSGAENIRMSAAIIGLSRRELAARFDEIVAFAELEAFLDMPVRHYSSGMQARLGFSVAVHVDGDVLLVDEALAVGDLSFQLRCIERMKALVQRGVTVVFVSHDVGLMSQFCSRAIWVDGGTVREDGPTADVLAHFQSALAPTSAA